MLYFRLDVNIRIIEREMYHKSTRRGILFDHCAQLLLSVTQNHFFVVLWAVRAYNLLFFHVTNFLIKLFFL